MMGVSGSKIEIKGSLLFQRFDIPTGISKSVAG
jgi:hypothetical protein